MAIATWLVMLPDGMNSARFVAGQAGHFVLQGVDGGVLAVHIVAHHRRRHGAAHVGVGAVTVSERRSTRAGEGESGRVMAEVMSLMLAPSAADLLDSTLL